MILIVRALIAAILVSTVVAEAECEKFGHHRSALSIDMEWVMQGYQIGFQGFFVELLGFADSLARLLPRVRLVKSSFRKSLDESPFANEQAFLSTELFEEEAASVVHLTSQDAPKSGSTFPKFLGRDQLAAISCKDSSGWEVDYAYIGGELSRHIASSPDLAGACCEACVADPLCLAWTFDSGRCSLKGRMDQSGLVMPGATSGRMISRPTETSEANVGAASPATVVQQQVKRRAQVPRVVVFHGTTCIQRNQSISMATRDINTILIGRYMLERPYLVGGYNLDEYAVMHCAARMDEIWVPTEWHRAVFQRLFAQQGSASSMPLITVIPEAVDTGLFDPHYNVEGPRRSIVGADRLYLADATRLTEAQRAESSIRLAVQKECIFTPEGGVECANSQRFEFLSIFKWEYRKGWDIMLDAYWAAFAPTDQVTLRIRSYVPHTSAGDRNLTRVIETYAERVHGKGLDELAKVVWETGVEGFTVPYPNTPAPEVMPTAAAAVADGSGGVSDAGDIGGQGGSAHDSGLVMEQEEAAGADGREEAETQLTREDMRALLASANAFVLPTRGEGWGLPIAEAMAMALPVIVTNHSGPAAYATADNAYLIPVLSDTDAYSFAKPDTAVLSQLMRQVIADSSREGGYVAQQKGLRARETMQGISADEIVCKMNERLRYHASLRGWDLP